MAQRLVLYTILSLAVTGSFSAPFEGSQADQIEDNADSPIVSNEPASVKNPPLVGSSSNVTPPNNLPVVPNPGGVQISPSNVQINPVMPANSNQLPNGYPSLPSIPTGVVGVTPANSQGVVGNSNYPISPVGNSNVPISASPTAIGNPNGNNVPIVGGGVVGNRPTGSQVAGNNPSQAVGINGGLPANGNDQFSPGVASNPNLPYPSVVGTPNLPVGSSTSGIMTNPSNPVTGSGIQGNSPVVGNPNLPVNSSPVGNSNGISGIGNPNLPVGNVNGIGNPSIPSSPLPNLIGNMIHNIMNQATGIPIVSNFLQNLKTT